MRVYIKVFIILSMCFILLISCSTVKKSNSDIDYVPDENTAIKIAEAIWLPIYGEIIYDSLPFKAKLDSSKTFWIVDGTLVGRKGGTPYAEIRRKDCKVIYVTHYK